MLYTQFEWCLKCFDKENLYIQIKILKILENKFITKKQKNPSFSSKRPIALQISDMGPCSAITKS